MKLFILYVFFISVCIPNVVSAIGSKPLQRSKRANVYLFMGAPDFYYTLDTYIVTFKNAGRLKTQTIVTTLPAGPFTITQDNCVGVQLASGATCDITITYNHPGTYPQSRILKISGAGFSVEAYIGSCDPMLC